MQLVTHHTQAYKQYLKSPEWVERKRRFYASHPRRCAACGTYKKIHLHHVRYDNLSREPDEDLVPLCLTCHRNAHAVAKSGRYESLADATEAIVSAGQARQWRHKQYRRFSGWLMSRLKLQP